MAALPVESSTAIGPFGAEWTGDYPRQLALYNKILVDCTARPLDCTLTGLAQAQVKPGLLIVPSDPAPTSLDSALAQVPSWQRVYANASFAVWRSQLFLGVFISHCPALRAMMVKNTKNQLPVKIPFSSHRNFSFIFARHNRGENTCRMEQENEIITFSQIFYFGRIGSVIVALVILLVFIPSQNDQAANPTYTPTIFVLPTNTRLPRPTNSPTPIATTAPTQAPTSAPTIAPTTLPSATATATVIPTLPVFATSSGPIQTATPPWAFTCCT